DDMTNSYVKLGDLATYINGYAFKPKDRGDKGLPIIRIQDLTGNTYDKGFYDGKYPSKIEINNGDVLISWSASLGVYLWNGGKALLNQHIFKVIFDKKEIDKDYFIYAVRFSLKRLHQLTHGATMKHIVKKDFDNVVIPYPSIKKQKEIAFNLDKIESIIKTRQQEIRMLDTLIKARFVEMFGDPMIKKDDRNLRKLKEICIINPKKNLASKFTNDIEVSFVPMSSVSEQGDIDVSQRKNYSEVRKGFTYFAENDVLFAKITPCMENGKGAIATGLINGIGFGSTEFHILRPIKNITNPYWIYVLTSFKSFRKLAEVNMTGSAGQRRVPATFLKDYEVRLPPLSLQNDFAAFV
ncbi:restriction endonuclease subunit S, partial [Lactobacillus amylovorus]|uniref:restriction endonuclease subunit S n=1 Tax=Lactobacillus amylovorus TaxID=1604 RepID=UPI002330B936